MNYNLVEANINEIGLFIKVTYIIISSTQAVEFDDLAFIGTYVIIYGNNKIQV